MSLRYILLLQRDVGKAAQFYKEGIGLQLKVLTDKWAELQSGDATIALKATKGEAYCSVGYTPILTFDVPDLQDALTKSLALGAQMDGAVQYFAHGKLAVLRAPDGHMISLIEGSSSSIDSRRSES